MLEVPQFLGNIDVQVFIQKAVQNPHGTQDSQQGQNPQTQPETSDPVGRYKRDKGDAGRKLGSLEQTSPMNTAQNSYAVAIQTF